MMQKKWIGLGVTVLVLALSGAAQAGQDCKRGYMKDPCAADGYSIVETEKNVRAPHNWMCIAHHWFPDECVQEGKNAARAHSPVARVD